MSKILLYVRVIRFHTLFISLSQIISFFMYTKFNYNQLNISSFCFTSLSILFFHLSVNSISEYRDCIKGVDNDKNSDLSKYRLVFGAVPKKNVFYIGICSFVIGSIFGIIALISSSSIYLIIPGILGAACSLFYSEKPFMLKYKALGEIVVFLVYGPIFGMACIISLTKSFCLNDFLFSIPFGLFTTNILLANNIRDYKFDLGKTKTLSTKYGLKFSYSLLFFITHLAFLLNIILIYKRALPKLGFIVFLAYPLIFLSLRFINSYKFVNIFGILQFVYCILVSVSIYF